MRIFYANLDEKDAASLAQHRVRVFAFSRSKIMIGRASGKRRYETVELIVFIIIAFIYYDPVNRL